MQVVAGGMMTGGRVTRRRLGQALLGGAALAGVAPGAVAAGVLPDPVMRDAALRGLALLAHRGDPVSARLADQAIAALAETDPEGALLARLYRALDVRPAGDFWRAEVPADAGTLALLHDAVREARSVSFAYRDLDDRESVRTVLPLALVHPPQGVKLLAWCGLRADYRQFFVREMQGLSLGADRFAERRFALLQGLVQKERA